MITLLFGAGATIPFVERINSNDFLQAIRQDSNWDIVLKKIPVGVNVSRLIIKKYARRILRVTRNESNFERIIEICDKVADFYVESYPEDSLFRKELSIIGYPLCHTGVKRRNSISIIPFLIREIIVNYIIEKENYQKRIAYDEYNLLITLQKKLIDFVCLINEKVSLVSLNYDSVLFNSLVDDIDSGTLRLGFTHGFTKVEGRGAMFNAEAFLAANRTIVFPHGSLLFNNLGGIDIAFNSNISSAESNRWKGLLNGWPSNTSIGKGNGVFTDFNSFIVSGQVKEISLNRHPYNQFYYKMITSLLDSELIVTIGFSYEDEHISNLIKNRLLYNNSVKLLFVDYQSRVVSNLSLVKKFEDLFNMATVMDVDVNQKKSYKRDPIITRLSLEQEGWLTDYVYYYGKGYALFLQEFEEVFRRMRVV